ncbi:hypothetical protein BGZ65_011625, partial [Modicella reniformis]
MMLVLHAQENTTEKSQKVTIKNIHKSWTTVLPQLNTLLDDMDVASMTNVINQANQSCNNKHRFQSFHNSVMKSLSKRISLKLSTLPPPSPACQESIDELMENRNKEMANLCTNLSSVNDANNELDDEHDEHDDDDDDDDNNNNQEMLSTTFSQKEAQKDQSLNKDNEQEMFSISSSQKDAQKVQPPNKDNEQEMLSITSQEKEGAKEQAHGKDNEQAMLSIPSQKQEAQKKQPRDKDNELEVLSIPLQKQRQTEQPRDEDSDQDIQEVSPIPIQKQRQKEQPRGNKDKAQQDDNQDMSSIPSQKGSQKKQPCDAADNDQDDIHFPSSQKGGRKNRIHDDDSDPDNTQQVHSSSIQVPHQKDLPSSNMDKEQQDDNQAMLSIPKKKQPCRDGGDESAQDDIQEVFSFHSRRGSQTSYPSPDLSPASFQDDEVYLTPPLPGDRDDVMDIDHIDHIPKISQRILPMELTTPPLQRGESSETKPTVFTPLRQKPPIRPGTVFASVRQQATINSTAVDKGKQVVRETDVDKEKRPPLAKRTRSRRLIKGRVKDSDDNDEDDDDDDDDDAEYRDDDSFITDASDSLEPPPPLRQPLGNLRTANEVGEGSSRTTRQQAAWSSTNNNISTSSTTTTSTTSQAGPAKKPRRETRYWTIEEENRLLELAAMPRFNYCNTADKKKNGKKRQVKWSQLKTYDQQHGNILQHRTQVMLKDKHRDLNDQGAHRERVAEYNRKKTTSTGREQVRTPSI